MIDEEVISGNHLWLRLSEYEARWACDLNWPLNPSKNPDSGWLEHVAFPANHALLLVFSGTAMLASTHTSPSAFRVCEISCVNHNWLQRAGVMSWDQICLKALLKATIQPCMDMCCRGTAACSTGSMCPIMFPDLFRFIGKRHSCTRAYSAHMHIYKHTRGRHTVARAHAPAHT